MWKNTDFWFHSYKENRYKAPRTTLRALLFHIYGNGLLALSEKLTGINVHLDFKPILQVQFLHNNNCGIIWSLPERADKGYLSAL